MGSCFSSTEHGSAFEDNRKRRQSSMGVGMGVAIMMQNAGAFVGAPAPDLASLHAQIRKAKAEGRTVTMVNGTLYFDYQMVARIPPHFDLNV
ncbi:unnamed protein product [Cylicocyclus nassatus]|uniref:Uncharacterized protein n=1 Tax=Cylicocyclus nassatus TaxID=53992 RepID=A0AA36HHL1_CYLNA|nr:unnamed protein product [Cylicocyclus nassatus]